MASTPSSEKDISQALKCSPSEQLTAFLPKSFLSVRHNSALGVRGFSDGHELNQEMGWGASPQQCLQEGPLH